MKKDKNIIALFLCLAIMVLCSFTNVTEAELKSQGVTNEQMDYLRQDVVRGKTGVITLPECHATLDVPKGFVFLDHDQSKKLLIDYWGNPNSHVSSNVLGALVPETAEAFYQVSVAYIISYDNCGYVKDDDANSIDYNELLKRMQEDCDRENDSLPKEQRMWLTGWAVPPCYVTNNHTLIWAKTFKSENGVIVNYDMRVLAKDGLVSINAVISPEDVEEVKELQTSIVGSISFDEGFKYSDFDESRDRVSDWTIGGLIAGGVLAKTGVLAKIGVFLLKMWKIILLGIVGIGAAITKFFRKNKEE